MLSHTGGLGQLQEYAVPCRDRPAGSAEAAGRQGFAGFCWVLQAWRHGVGVGPGAGGALQEASQGGRACPS